MPWQREVADVSGEVLPSGRMAYPVVVLIVPRRAGKTALTLARGIQRAASARNRRVWYTAQTGGDAGSTFREDWLPMVNASPYAPLITTRLSNGSESLTIPRLSSRIGLFAPTERALHGKAADDVTVDEAWSFSAVRGEAIEAAIRPTMATRPARQLWIISAGGTFESEWLLGWRELGRALTGPDQGVAYFEWHPAIDARGMIVDDLDDPAVWQATHPAIGHTIDLAALVDDHKSMAKTEGLFHRSYLDVFTSAGGGRVIPARAWRDCVDDQAAKLEPGPGLMLGYDVAGDRSAASITLAARVPERVDRHGETVPARLAAEVVDHRPGVGWVAARVAELRRRYGVRVVADSFGPASTVTRDLVDLGVDVDTLDSRAYLDGCAELLDDVLTTTLLIRDQGPLNHAAAIAAKRVHGDGWAFSRKNSLGDISPLTSLVVAAARARHNVSRRPTIRTGPSTGNLQVRPAPATLERPAIRTQRAG